MGERPDSGGIRPALAALWLLAAGLALADSPSAVAGAPSGAVRIDIVETVSLADSPGPADEVGPAPEEAARAHEAVVTTTTLPSTTVEPPSGPSARPGPEPLPTRLPPVSLNITEGIAVGDLMPGAADPAVPRVDEPRPPPAPAPADSPDTLDLPHIEGIGDACPAGSKRWIGSGIYGWDWDTPANWEGGTLPASVDDVCLDVGAAGAVFVDQDHVVASLLVASGGLEIKSVGSLTLSAGAHIDGTLTVFGDLLAGSTPLANDGVIDWRSGTIQATVQNQGSLTVSGTTLSVSLDGSLANTGVVTQSRGLPVTAGHVLTNEGTYDITGNYPLSRTGSGTLQLVNAAGGVIRKSGGTGDSLIGSGAAPFAVENYGTIEVLSGTLKIQDVIVLPGTTFDVAAGAELWLYGNAAVISGHYSSTGGFVRWQNAVAAAGNSFTASGPDPVVLDFPRGMFQVYVPGRPLSSAGGFVNEGDIDWQSGTLEGDLTNHGALLVASSGSHVLDGSLANTGAGVVTQATGFSITAGHVFTNQGLLDFTGAYTLSRSGTGTVSLVNAAGGIIRKSAGTGEASLGTAATPLAVEHYGTFEVQAGKLSVHDATVLPGQTFGVSPGAELWVYGDDAAISDHYSSTGGFVRWQNATAATAMGSFVGAGPEPVVFDFAPGAFALYSPSDPVVSAGGFINAGELNWLAGTISGDLANDGTLLVTTTGSHTLDGSLDNGVSGLVAQSSGLAVTVGHAVTNEGTFDFAGNYGMTRSGTGTVSLLNAGTGTIVKSAGTGDSLIGTQAYPIAVDNQGTIEVRSGAISVGGGITNSATGTVKVHISGTAASGSFGKVKSYGAASLAGTIAGVAAAGLVIDPLDGYTVMTFPSRTGAFAHVGGGFAAEYAATSVVLRWANAPPEAVNDHYTTNQGAALGVPAPGVLENDADANSDPLSASLFTGTAHGDLDLASDGGFTYVPDPAFAGDDTFTYVAGDGVATSAPATVTITVVASVELAVAEAVAMSDAVVVAGPALLDVTEGAVIEDAVDAVAHSAEVSVEETVAIGDVVVVSAPVVVEVAEMVGVVDVVEAVAPPAEVVVVEAVSVGDGVAVLPPASLGIDEAVEVADVVGATGPVVVAVFEGVGVLDSVGHVLSPAVAVAEVVGVVDVVGMGVSPAIGVVEGVVVGDVVVVSAPVVVEVAEMVEVADTAMVAGPVSVGVSEEIGVGDVLIQGLSPALAVDEMVTVGDAATVTPSDNTAPVVTVPGNMTVEPTGPAGAAVWFTATADDMVDGPVPVSCTPASGAVFPLGDTTVVCAATDAAGNTGTGSFIVAVVDSTPPALIVPGGLVVPASSAAGAIVSWVATADDAVDGSVPVDCAPPSGTVFPIGDTGVACEATDGAGNTGRAEFVVSVTNQPPHADAGGPYAGEEGAAILMSGLGSSDANSNLVAFAWDLDGDGQFDDATGSSASVTFLDDGDYPLALRVVDSEGLTDTATTVVRVENVAPSVEELTGPSSPLFPGEAARVTVVFSDPGSDTHAVVFAWGDGTTYGPIPAVGSAFASHVYASAGEFVVKVTVTDDDGGIAIGLLSVSNLDYGQATESIVARIDQLEALGELRHGDATVLVNHLDKALAQYEKGRPSQAVRQIDLFVARVARLVSLGRLDPSLGADLTTQALRMRAAYQARRG